MYSICLHHSLWIEIGKSLFSLFVRENLMIYCFDVSEKKDKDDGCKIFENRVLISDHQRICMYSICLHHSLWIEIGKSLFSLFVRENLMIYCFESSVSRGYIFCFIQYFSVLLQCSIIIFF